MATSRPHNKVSVALQQEAETLLLLVAFLERSLAGSVRLVETAAWRGNGMQAFSACVCRRLRHCPVCSNARAHPRVFWRNHTGRMTHQFFGLDERVLDISEAEAGHGDELAHHRHKLVTWLLRPFLLVFQFLQVEIKRSN